MRELASTPMGPSGSRSEVIYHDDMFYEACISSKFILVHKRVLVITQGFIEDNEQVL